MIAEVLGADASAEALPVGGSPHRLLLYRFFAGMLLAAFVMVLSLAISTGYGFGALRQLRSDIDAAHWVLLAVSVPALLLLGVPVVRGAFHDLRAGRLTLNVLFLLGTGSAVGVSLFSYARGTGPVYLETATMLLALYTLGRYLDARAKGETTRVLGRLLEVPTATFQRVAPEPAEVPGTALRVGDRVQIRAGDVFPVDGRVRSGSSFVDESSLTGEARPARKQAGDPVYAGTANLDGLLTLDVTAVAGERRLAQIEHQVRAAMERPGRLVAATDRIMRWLIPAVIVLALATFGVWFVVDGYEKALYAALSVVLIACPCALGLAIPLTLVVSLGQAARQGVLVRSGQSLLDLARVTTFLFDKTGTLSTMHTQRVQVEVAARVPAHTDEVLLDTDRLLAYVASIEHGARHPLATAVLREAEHRGLERLPTQDVRTLPGAGVVGQVWDGGTQRQVAIGGEALLDALGLPVHPPLRAEKEPREAAGQTVLYVVVEEEPVALAVLEEQVHEHAAAAAAALQREGLGVHILTGDRVAAGRRVADRLGVPAHGGLLPSEKQACIGSFRAAHGPVAMVGDGVNDAAALAEADVGIALASGAGTAVEAADITLYNPDLRTLPYLVELARRTRRTIRQNLGWTFGYNAIGLGLAVFGLLHPLVAVVIMLVSSGLVTANALRIRKTPTP